MASTNKTSKGLNAWLPTDLPAMDDFNTDNQVASENALWKDDYDPTGAVAAAGGIPAYQAANGMKKSDYDPAGAVATAGGIPAFALSKSGLAQVTGTATDNAMSQKAATDAFVENSHVGVGLWTGSWTSGNIAVPGISNYSQFSVATNLGDGVATLLGSNFRFMGNYATDSRITVASLDATLSGNTLTWKNGYGIQLLPSATSLSAKQPLTVAGIYGII